VSCAARQPVSAHRISRRAQSKNPHALSRASPLVTVDGATPTSAARCPMLGSSRPSRPIRSSMALPIATQARVSRPGRRWSWSLARNCARCSRSRITRGPAPKMEPRRQRRGHGPRRLRQRHPLRQIGQSLGQSPRQSPRQGHAVAPPHHRHPWHPQRRSAARTGPAARTGSARTGRQHRASIGSTHRVGDSRTCRGRIRMRHEQASSVSAEGHPRGSPQTKLRQPRLRGCKSRGDGRWSECPVLSYLRHRRSCGGCLRAAFSVSGLLRRVKSFPSVGTLCRYNRVPATDALLGIPTSYLYATCLLPVDRAIVV
jgi:hypothetical protein